MPRIKPPPAKPASETPEIEEYVSPVGAIEIDLPDESGETQIEVTPAPAAAAPPAPPPPEPPVEDNPLQKALDAQKRAEEMQRTAQRERDEALRHAQEREEELTRERGDREDAQYNSVLTAIAAEQSAIDKAEADYAAYAAAGDWASAGKAQRIMASASARLDRLEDGKQAFETKRETPKTTPPAAAAPAPPAAPQDFEQRIAQMPEVARGWLRKHPEFINDAAMNRKIGGAHNYLVDNKGLQPFSEAYFDALDTEFGFKAAPAAPTAQPQRRSIPMSAPVSRDTPTYSGQKPASTTMTLTEEERRIARTAYTAPDMTDAQKEYAYAKNKQKLQRMRANGEYRQTTEQTG
jgi:hypothetical protein